jgi:type I restriction enzyme S subunit
LIGFIDVPTSAREAQAGDLLFGATSKKRTYGCVGVASDDSGRPAYADSTLTILRPEPTVCSQYLVSLLGSTSFAAQVSKQAMIGLQSRNDASLLRRVKLVLPPLAEQQKIAAILEAVPLQAIQQAQVKSRAMYHALACDAFNGGLSRRWHTSSSGHKQAVNPAPNNTVGSIESELTSLGTFKRAHRTSAIKNLSKFQRLVWRALRVRAQILIADDPDSFESFCTSRSLLPLRDLVSHNQVRRTLEQIAALGLIQMMSVPPRGKGDASRYLVAFRAYRQNEVGRINEDTASRDAQSLRTSIFEIDLGL